MELRGVPCFLDPARLLSPCTGEPLAAYTGHTMPLHNDPRLDHGFLTDHWAPRGRIPRSLQQGDTVGFMALVEPPGEPGRRYIGLVALLTVEKIVDTAATGWEKAVMEEPVLAQSPHYWRAERDNPVALLGEAVLLEPPPPLSAPGRLTEPSTWARSLLGEAAERLARGRFRRSRLLALDAAEVLDQAERLGSAPVPGSQRPLHCAPAKTRPQPNINKR